MFFIDELNEELLDILNGYSDWFFNLDHLRIKLDGKPDPDGYYVGEKYLELMKTYDKNSKEGEGFPMKTYGNNCELLHVMPNEYVDTFQDYRHELVEYLGARNSAVAMWYPKNGYMSWHNNANVSGYNILISYNKTGDGWFRYQEPTTKEIVTLQDRPGWAVKVGYFGSFDEPDKIFWHCAKTFNEDRLTFGFVLPHLEMWEMMIEDIRA